MGQQCTVAAQVVISQMLLTSKTVPLVTRLGLLSSAWHCVSYPFMSKCDKYKNNKTLCRETGMGQWVQQCEIQKLNLNPLIKKRVSPWLPSPPILICLSAVCFVSCSSASIARTQSFNHGGFLLRSTPGSQRVGWGSQKKKMQLQSESRAERALAGLDGRHRPRVLWHICKGAFEFGCFWESSIFYFMSVTQCTNACSGTLKWYSEM